MDCYFRIDGDRYILGNRYIERVWKYDGSGLYTISIRDRLSGMEWVNRNARPYTEIAYEGLTNNIRDRSRQYSFELTDTNATEVADSIYSRPYIEAVFSLRDRLHGVDIRRHAIVYEGAAAIRTFIEVKSVNLPMGDFYSKTRYNVLDAYPVNMDSGSISSFEFFTRTDNTNRLVEERKQPEGFDRGSLLICSTPDNGGFFILKESPCFSDQRLEADGDFQINRESVNVLGWGIRPEEVPSEGFRKTYGSVIALFGGSLNDGFAELKRYQRARAIAVPDRDYCVMANPWGDRQCMEHMGEGFVVRELEACARLGATHYQLDDGWQKGNGLIHLVDNEDVGDGFWEIDRSRFPDGFDKIAAKAAELNVELALWFAPDYRTAFRNWKKQADLLYGMYAKYGIKKFKIDAVQLRNKESEENLEKLFKLLRDRSRGEITFNLDTTADPRAGYFMFQEYGNIFLENRYTDWGNYYPWLTLKNLWDLCRFVPAHKLQIEFLNTRRNTDKYDSSDLLAPGNYSFEYIFAVAMFASPLCWFEPSALDSGMLNSYSHMIALHRKYREDIFAGCILPIGDRPDGYSWTGFQSHNCENQTGFIIVYREAGETSSHSFSLAFADRRNIRLQSLSDESPDIEVRAYDNNGINITLENKNSFRLYRYVLS